MTRAEILNRLCGLFPNPSYLEIGVFRGETFMEVQAARKIGVDPNFAFDIHAAMAAQPHATLLAMTSDALFAAPPPNPATYDVIFLDGLHTAEQTLRDLLNAIELLKPYGVIVLDDILPPSYHAALPGASRSIRLREALHSTDTRWMGDVYRLAFFIETFLQAFTTATVGGQMLLWRARRPAEALVQRSLEEVGRMPFEETVFQRGVFNICPLEEAIRRMGR